VRSFETQAVEWKSAWRDEYLKWVCGFANAHGGVLEIGKDDDGVVVGVADARRLLEEIPNKINTTMAIVADVDLRSDDGLDHLVVTVEPYPYPISYHGKYYLRSGATNRELTGHSLDEFLLRKQGKTWDGVPVPYVGVGDLDLVAFRDFRKKALASARLTAADLEISDAALIDSLRLAEGNHLKRAAVLLFHDDPERWVVGAYVKIGYFETGADLLYQDEVHGPLISMADKVLDIIYTKYFRGMISYEGIQRVETFPVPRAACREAVLNAIVHRDYGSGVPVQIKVFPDRVIIYSDGGLPENWTVADLLAQHGSVPRNPNIAGAFFRSGQIETWGRGIEKIEAACMAAGKPPPLFEATSTEVRVTFPYRIGVGDLSSPRGDDNGVDRGDDTVAPHSARKILIALAAAPTITQARLSQATGLSPRTVSRGIRKLREAGMISRIGSDRQGSWQILARTSDGLSDGVTEPGPM